MASKDDEQRSGLTDAAGWVAFFPARAAAWAWRGPLEEAVDEVLSAPEIARVLDRALARCPLQVQLNSANCMNPMSSGLDRAALRP